MMKGWDGIQSSVSSSRSSSTISHRVPSQSVRLGRVQHQAPTFRTIFCNDREANSPVRFKGDDLKSKTEFVKRMEWGMNIDFQKVFDRILDVAVKGNLKEEQMIKRIFVFSDMEFDQASRNSWEIDYQAITRKYREKGYGSAVPQIVFWNLRDSKATPVPATKKGVALVSGFSKNLLTLFLDNEGDISPVSAMEAAIAGPEYQKLVLLD